MTDELPKVHSAPPPVNGRGSPLERQGLSVNETAQVIGVGRGTIYRLIRDGELQALKIRSRTIILREEIARFLAGKAAN